MDGEDNDQQLARLSKTEISLTLTNKFEVPDDDDSDIKALFVRYYLLYSLLWSGYFRF